MREFLGIFPALKVTEFKHAAQALINIELPTENITCKITAMESLKSRGRNLSKERVHK